MNNLFIQTVWKIMNRLQGADQLEDALSAGLEVLCSTMDCEEGAIWMMDSLSGNLVAVSSAGPVNYKFMISGIIRAQNLLIWLLAALIEAVFIVVISYLAFRKAKDFSLREISES